MVKCEGYYTPHYEYHISSEWAWLGELLVFNVSNDDCNRDSVETVIPRMTVE